MEEWYADNILNQGESAQDKTSGRAVQYSFNFSYSMEWDGGKSDFQGAQSIINNFHSRFYDATDGQMIIDTVDIWDDRNWWDVVDVRKYSQSGRAFTIRGGISQASYHIYLFSGDGGKVLHHEWGHYAMYLPDEYTDSGGAFCTCIMGTCWNTDEYCCDSNHNYNHQYAESKSCWQQIKDRYTKVTEKDPPSPGPTNAPAINYRWHDKMDLAIGDSNLTTSISSPSDGDKVRFNATFYNFNFTVDTNVKVRFYDGDPDLGGTSIGEANANARKKWYVDVSLNWSATPGTHEIFAVVDPDNAITEFNENNNKAKITLTVNYPPVIDPTMPDEFNGYEDEDLVIDLSDYEIDVEDSGPDLLWRVTDWDDTVLDGYTGDDSDDDLFTFTPKPDWYGKTSVTFELRDTRDSTVTKVVELAFESVNDLPSVTNLTATSDRLLRSEGLEIYGRGTDIETYESMLEPVLEIGHGDPVQWTEHPVSWDEEHFSASFETGPDTALGTYSVRFMVIDEDAGESPWVYLNNSFAVLNNDPAISDIVISEETIYRSESVAIQFGGEDYEDDLSEMVWELEVYTPDGEWVPVEDMVYTGGFVESEFVAETDTELGTYMFRARITDMDGSSTEWLEDPDMVYVLNNVPATESISVDIAELYRTESLTVTFDGSDVEDQESDLVPDLLVSYGGGDWSDEGLSDPEYDHDNDHWTATYTSSSNSDIGSIKFKVSFTDLDGDESNEIESAPVQIRNNIPDAVATGPTEVKTGENAEFSSTGSNDVEGQLTYLWKFGDGKSSTDANPVHKYQRHGTFTVSLTVKDANGASDSTTVTVNVKQKSTGPLNPFDPDEPGSQGLSAYMLPIALIIVVVIVLIAAAVAIRSRSKKSAPPPGPTVPLEPSPHELPAGQAATPPVAEPVPDIPPAEPEPEMPPAEPEAEPDMPPAEPGPEPEMPPAEPEPEPPQEATISKDTQSQGNGGTSEKPEPRPEVDKDVGRMDAILRDLK
jgi:PKD repeat protein